MKKVLFTTLIAAVILPFLSSCQKSEPSGTSNSGSIVGQWQMTIYNEQYLIDGKVSSEELGYADAQNGALLEFYPDNTFVFLEIRDGVASTPMDGTYIKTPDIIVLTFSDDFTETFKIESQTATEITVVQEEKREEDGHVYGYVVRLSFRKV